MLRGFVSTTGFLVCLFTVTVPFAPASEPLRESTEEFFFLARDGVLTVENTDGAIRIYGWNEPRVRLVALRKAYSAARLHTIRVETNARPASLVVRTRIPPATGFFADRSGTVDYTITVPETARLEKLYLVNGEIALRGLRGGSANAEIVNGRISALNCFAQVRARAVNGAMEAFFDWWESFPVRVDYAIGHGTIRAKIPRQASLSVDAQTASGHITDQFKLPKEQQGGAGMALRAATATDPTMSLLFRSGGGNISIDAMH